MTITTTCLQTIVNHAETINLNRRRVIGIQYTKSQIANVTETITRLPWQIKVKNSAYYDYADPATRALVEQLDYLDRRYVETISFSNNANLSYFFKYQGDLTPSQQSQLTVNSFTGNTLVLNVNSASITAGKYVVKQGDFVQIVGFPYPFTALNDVVYVSGSTVTITTHRPNFIDPINGYANQNVNWGNAVEFQVFCNNMPTYTFVKAGNTAAITFDSEFQLYEYTGNLVTNINEVVG